MAPQDKNPAAVNPSSLPLPTDTQHLLSQPPGAPPGFLPQEALNPFTVNPLELSLLYQKAGVKPKGLTIFPPTEMTLPCQRVLATAPHVQNQNTALQSAPQLPRDIPTAYPVLVKLEYVKQMYHMKLGIEDLHTGLRAWSDSYKKFNPNVDMKSLSYDWDRSKCLFMLFSAENTLSSVTFCQVSWRKNGLATMAPDGLFYTQYACPALFWSCPIIHLVYRR
jgi:hypothetical protein